MGWMKRFDGRPEYVKAVSSWWDWHCEPIWAVLVLAVTRRCTECTASRPYHHLDCSRRR